MIHGGKPGASGDTTRPTMRTIPAFTRLRAWEALLLHDAQVAAAGRTVVGAVVVAVR